METGQTAQIVGDVPEFKVIIPARYASSRLPGKPLLDIGYQPMIQHVRERALESGAAQVVVATDDERIADAVRGFDGQVMLTSSDHHSGTDRVAEVARRLDWGTDDIVVNLQGDEPGMPSSLIGQVARDMAEHPHADVTTLASPIREHKQLFDPHVVKVVMRADGYALYFSRAPIPWHRDEFDQDRTQLPDAVRFFRHIGLYAYRVGFLESFVSMPPAPIEQAESLEQLRVLWNGGRIHISEALEPPGHGVDTVDDLNAAREAWSHKRLVSGQS